jgi:mono/diheme cytochrome c family protein
MKEQSVCVALFIWLFWGCQSDSYTPPPPVTSQMLAASIRKQSHANVAVLREGRTLFVRRCIECHTLPAVRHYRTDEWPGIVSSMSHRASLKPAEREAIVAYILAVRSQY